MADVNEDPQSALKEAESTFIPSSHLTDVGQYAYAALCSYAFGKLYGGSATDRAFITKWIKTIIEHIGQTDVSTETMIAIGVGEVPICDGDPFVDTLKVDPYIHTHGVHVVAEDLVTLALKEGVYDARMRTMLKYVSLLLRVDWEGVEVFEDSVVVRLQELEHELSEEEKKERDSKGKIRKIKRIALITAAAIGTGTLLGLTGGLAAPLIAAGAGAVIGSAGAAALGSVAGVAIIGSLFGVAGVGLGGYKMKKRVGNVEEFEFEPLSEGRQLHVTLAVSGWLTEDVPDFKAAWRGLNNGREQYVLRYESKYLLELGKAISYLMDIAIKAATQEALKFTILSGILAAVAWPAALLSAAAVIDNPWSVCAQRAVGAGRQLAEVLLSRQQGKRPVTLIGFSLGARVIFYCLQELAKRKNSEGIVEDVVLLGAPVTGNPKEWQPLARVVAGKIVNGYCKGDWLLKFLYRTASAQMSIAGLKAIDWEDRRMHNVDLSYLVTGHMDYQKKIDDILCVVGIRTKEHAEQRAPDSLRQWVQIQKSSTQEKLAQKAASGTKSGSLKGGDIPKDVKVKVKQDDIVDTRDVLEEIPRLHIMNPEEKIVSDGDTKDCLGFTYNDSPISDLPGKDIAIDDVSSSPDQSAESSRQHSYSTDHSPQQTPTTDEAGNVSQDAVKSPASSSYTDGLEEVIGNEDARSSPPVTDGDSGREGDSVAVKKSAGLQSREGNNNVGSQGAGDTPLAQ